MRSSAQWIVLIFLLLMVVSCAPKENPGSRGVQHLFTDGQWGDVQGVLVYPTDGTSLKSVLSYPNEDAIWAGNWNEKPSLRLESTIPGDLRGSFYLFREDGKSNFSLTGSSWLGGEGPSSWTGLVFWMANHTRQSVGVRWRVVPQEKRLEIQIFRYAQPQLTPLQTQSFPFSNSHWAPFQLMLSGNQCEFRVEGQTLTYSLNPQWKLGDFWGFYQGYGTGYLSELSLQSEGQEFSYRDLWQHWNEEILHTTEKVLLDSMGSFSTPDESMGNKVPIRRIAIAGEWRVAVPVHCPSRIFFQVKVPANARLHAGFGILSPFTLSDTTADFEIRAKSQGTEILLASRTICPARESIRSFRYQDFHISLDAYRGQEMQLILQVRKLAGEEPLMACWSEPVISVHDSSASHPNVLLILLDTLRSDRVGVYGDTNGLTPHTDELARTGTVFRQTVSQAPWTTPSHASFFTSLYPSETGCDHPDSQGNRLQEAYMTWAERLQRAGYNTAAFTSGIKIRGDIGFNQGFDRYQDVEYDNAYSFETIFERTRQWFQDHEGEPWFLFVHTYAVHFPYKHQQYLDYRSIPRTWEDQRQIDIDSYNGGVRYADEWVGALIRELDQRKLRENTFILLTSDHGEDLGERGMPRPARHGHSLYDELLRVPLILHWPGMIPTGKQITNQVQLVDLLPTVLDALHLEQPAVKRGTSLMPLLRGEKSVPELAFSEGMTYGIAQRAIRTDSYKLIARIEPPRILDSPPTNLPISSPDPFLLFDLRKDPGETRNLFSEKKDILLDLQEQLKKILENLHPPAFFTGDSALREPPSLSPRLMEELQNLEYAKRGKTERKSNEEP